MRIFCFGLLTCVFGTASAGVAQEPIVISAKITWYGVYEAAHATEVADPASPTGKRYIATGVAPPVNSNDSVPFTPGTHFGFGYVLTGAPEGTLVTLEHIRKYPKPGAPACGTAQAWLEAKSTLTALVQRQNLFVGMNLGDLRSFAPGAWTLEVRSGPAAARWRRRHLPSFSDKPPSGGFPYGSSTHL